MAKKGTKKVMWGIFFGEDFAENVRRRSQLRWKFNNRKFYKRKIKSGKDKGSWEVYYWRNR